MEPQTVTADSVFPAAVLNAPRWGAYVLKSKDDGSGKLDKIPTTLTGKACAFTQSCRHTYQAAITGMGSKPAGLGFRADAESGYIAIDADGCVQDGVPTSIGMEILDRAQCAVFLSVSGTGMRMLIPRNPNRTYKFLAENKITERIGLYDGAIRYVTLTLGTELVQLNDKPIGPDDAFINWVESLHDYHDLETFAGGGDGDETKHAAMTAVDAIHWQTIAQPSNASVELFYRAMGIPEISAIWNGGEVPGGDSTRSERGRVMASMLTQLSPDADTVAKVMWQHDDIRRHCEGHSAGIGYALGRMFGRGLTFMNAIDYHAAMVAGVDPEAADIVRKALKPGAIDDITNARQEEFKTERAEEAAAGERLYWGDEMYEIPAPTYLIDKILPDSGVMMIYGATGAGKSFILIDLLLAIAARLKQWQGLYDIKGHRRVVYIAGEGSAGIAARYEAWCKIFNDGKPVPDFSLKTTRTDIQSDEGIAALEALIARELDEGDQPIIVFDTISSMAPGMKENDAEHVTPLLARLQSLGERHGSLIMYAHHSGKSGDGTAKGSVAFEANIGAHAEVWREDERAANRGSNPPYRRPDACVFTITKMKDDDQVDPIEFNWQSVPVRGDRTSLVMMHGPIAISPQRRLQTAFGGSGKPARMLIWEICCGAPEVDGRPEIMPDELLRQYTEKAIVADRRPHKLQPTIDGTIARGMAANIFVTNPDTGAIRELLSDRGDLGELA